MRIKGVCAAIVMTVLVNPLPAFAQEGADRIAEADAAEGEKLFRQCRACHTIEEGEPNRIGPNLYGVVGRPVASVEGFRYSNAMKNHGGEWTIARLDEFLQNPRAAIRGTNMAFAGLRKDEDRADLIAYLKTFGETDAADEEADAVDDEEAADTADESDSGQDFGLLFKAEGAEETYYTCTPCHSEMIVVQQGKTRDGWDDLIDWMVEEQGMAEPDEDLRNTILDYLAAHYNTDRPNFPRR